MSFKRARSAAGGVVGIVNINNNKYGTIGGVCTRNVMGIDFTIYGASDRSLSGSPIPMGVVLKGDNLNTKTGPRIKEDRTRGARRSVGGLLSSKAGVIFIATKVNNKANANTTPIVTNVTGKVNVLAINVVAVPFCFRGQGGVIGTLRNMRRVHGGISTLLVIGGRHLYSICTSSRVAMGSTFGLTSGMLDSTAGDVSRLVAIRKAVGLSFHSVRAAVGDNNNTVVTVNETDNRKEIRDTVGGTLSSPLLCNDSVDGTRHVLFGVCASDGRPVFIQRVERVSTFFSRLGPSVGIV